LILKVLGNAGHPASIKYFTKFLPIFGTQIPTFPLRVQVCAILALKTVAKKEPKLVSQRFESCFVILIKWFTIVFLNCWVCKKSNTFLSTNYIFNMVIDYCTNYSF